MKKAHQVFVFLALGWLSPMGNANSLPPHCEYNERCVVEVPGSLCADGSSSFFSLIPRKNSQDLVIYLEPGGACWDKETCDKFHVQKLKRKEPKNFNIPEQGLLNLTNSEYPFHEISIATIPYCTGDVFLGNNQMDYGTPEKPFPIYHHGFRNVVLSLEKIKESFSSPQRVILFGRSAGGLGVLGHIRTLDSFFPEAQKFALSDAGAPISPPYVDEGEYQKIMMNWKVSDTLPSSPEGESLKHFGDLLRYNTQHFPHIRFGYIQSFADPVMTYFVKTIGSSSPARSLKENIIASADDFIGRDTHHAKVFFINKKAHVITKTSLQNTVSMGTRLSDWLHQMFFEDHWVNVRPDLKTAE